MWIQEKGAAKNSYKVAAIAGGFIDVKDTIIIYTDAVEWAEDIDMERVNAEKSRAEEWLRDHEADGTCLLYTSRAAGYPSGSTS